MIGRVTYRKPLIAANWKMNPPPKGFDLKGSSYVSTDDVDVVVFPTFLELAECIAAELVCGAQCGRPEEKGPYTGDVGMTMIKKYGCEYVLCGHSERRRDHGETDVQVAAQAVAALKAGLSPVVCIGESAEDRAKGKEKDVIKKEIAAIFAAIGVRPSPDPEKIHFAYEPVWAIGNGKTATPQEAQEMHAFIRSLIPEDIRETTRILYGGSMTGACAHDLLMQPDIDGGLIGGASLRPDEFKLIVEIAGKLAKAE